jgi:hypothetical protein
MVAQPDKATRPKAGGTGSRHGLSASSAFIDIRKSGLKIR